MFWRKIILLEQPCQPCGFHPQKIEIWGYWNCLGKCGKSGEIWQKFRKMCIFALVTGLIKCSVFGAVWVSGANTLHTDFTVYCLLSVRTGAVTRQGTCALLLHICTSVSRKVWAKVWNKFVINWYKFVSKFKLILNQSTN